MSLLADGSSSQISFPETRGCATALLSVVSYSRCRYRYTATTQGLWLLMHKCWHKCCQHIESSTAGQVLSFLWSPVRAENTPRAQMLRSKHSAWTGQAAPSQRRFLHFNELVAPVAETVAFCQKSAPPKARGKSGGSG